VVALTVHEVSHAWAAYKLGDSFAKREGRLSLNPLRHIEPIGAILILLAGFGWAKPVRVNPHVFKDYKRDFALVALAGPVSNFALAFLSVGCMRLLLLFGYNTVIGYMFIFLEFLAVINVGLGIFNLIPIPPLDGSKVLSAFLPDSIYAHYMRLERHGMIILMAIIMMGRFGSLNLFGFIWRLRDAMLDVMFGIFFGSA
jgi:Zn-dependent protease